jgi:hypothetical protein
VLADAELIEPEALLCNLSVSMICLRSCMAHRRIRIHPRRALVHARSTGGRLFT